MSTGPQIVADCVSALAHQNGILITRSGVSQNVWELRGMAQCLLYIKGRGESPYHWGVTANVVTRLRERNQRWFIVLLFESKENGYLLSSTDVLFYIEQHVWPLAHDGDYKPAAPGRYLARNLPFCTFEEFINALLLA